MNGPARILLDKSQASRLVDAVLPQIREKQEKLYTGRNSYSPERQDIPPLDHAFLQGTNSSIMCLALVLTEKALKEKDAMTQKYMLEIAFSRIFKIPHAQGSVGSTLQWALFKIYSIIEPQLDKKDFFEDGHVVRLLEMLWYNTKG